MSEDSAQERSLPASARRLEKAREEGKAVRSPELATTVVLGSAGMALWWFGDHMTERMQVFLRAGLRINPRDAFDPVAMLQRMSALSMEGLLMSLPLLGVLVLAALVAPLVLGGWVFSLHAMRFDANRFNPISGMGRIVSMQGLAELGKAVAKAVLLTSVLAWLLWHFAPQAAQLGTNEARAGMAAASHMLLVAFLTLVGSMALLAAADVPLQLWRHYSGLRMTREEMKEEARESEGDPQIRSRVRSRQREMARRRMMSQVPKADVVVTNPTHFAVALLYREDRMRAPIVVAKGSGPVALRIREIAAQHGVPRLEAPPLARALHRHADIGEEVPAALYGAVAQVLVWVFQLKNRSDASEPPRPQGLEVPPELDPGEVMQ